MSSSNNNGYNNRRSGPSSGVIGERRNQQQQQQQQQRGDNNQRQYSSRNNTSPRQNTAGRRPQQRTGSSGQITATTARGGNGEPLKFEGEFDFEQANARFEQEIEKEFSDKLKISTSGKPQHNQREQTNDTSLTNSQSLSLQDLQDQQHIIMKQKSLHSGSDSLEKPQQKQDHDQHANLNNRSSIDEDQKNFYDKNISFFDRISCESNEKTQSKPKKLERRAQNQRRNIWPTAETTKRNETKLPTIQQQLR